MAETVPPDAGGRAAWSAALDALELSLDDAARAMAVSASSASDADGMGSAAGSTGDGGGNVRDAGDTATHWTPPAGLGSMPPELAVRVQDLLTNQHKLIGELEQARSLTIKHLAAVRSVPPERDARASVYLDVAG